MKIRIIQHRLIDIVTRWSSLVFCHSNSNKPDLLVKNKFPGEFLRIYKNLACSKKKHHLFLDQKQSNSITQKLHIIIMKTLSAQFDEMIIFGGVVFFFRKFWNFYTKSKIFNILRNIFIFYCRHPFNHELSVFICVIVMDKSMFCTLS